MHASGKREASGSVSGSFSPRRSKKSCSLYNPRRGRCPRRSAAYAEHIPDNAHETDSDPPMARIGHGLLAPHGSKDLGEHLEAKRSGDLPSEPPVIHTG